MADVTAKYVMQPVEQVAHIGEPSNDGVDHRLSAGPEPQPRPEGAQQVFEQETHANPAAIESSPSQPREVSGGDNGGDMMRLPSTGSNNDVLSLSQMDKKVDLKPWTDDGSANKDYLVVVLPKKKASPLGLGRLAKGKTCGGPTYKNITHSTLNTKGDLAGGIERLAANQAEVHEMIRMELPVLDLAGCLRPNEHILTTLPCVGFNGARTQRFAHGSQQI